MKRTYIKSLVVVFALMTLSWSCSDILEEQPRSIFTPDYFGTEQGVLGGISSLYAELRWIYGNGDYHSGMQAGTDESTWGAVVGANSQRADWDGSGQMTPSTNEYGEIWNTFPFINTASGIIENAAAVNEADPGTISDALIAEARFFRAYYYFLLVQTYGGVPLDLGAGELAFNNTTSRTSVRNTVPEVYTIAIFPDLLQAIADLPETPRLTGSASANLARLILAKAYLTYAWWLDNPQGIPTYPESPRSDIDGQSSAFYYQQAYDLATDVIDAPGPYALQPTFFDVHDGANDRHSEMMLYADHTEASSLYNGVTVSGWGNGGAPGNVAGWRAQFNYTEIRASSDPFSDPTGFVATGSIGREAVQRHGRPWTGTPPTHETMQVTFAEKDLDSRFDGTFSTSYLGNWQRNGNAADVLYNANGLAVNMEDPMLKFLDTDPGNVTWPAADDNDGKGGNNVGGGEVPGESYYVITPDAISRKIFPGCWKIGPYRTDNGNTMGQANVSYTRPFPAVKFSEAYFVAAEAAVQGATTDAGQTALDLINVIRARAGMWRWDNGENMERVEDNSAAMVAATPATIDIDYILDEMTREYYGEGRRWFDLARTQTWQDRAGTYTIGTSINYGDRTVETVTRTIPDYAYLRPIPQSQIDGLEMTEDEKAAYQNPGYNE